MITVVAHYANGAAWPRIRLDDDRAYPQRVMCHLSSQAIVGPEDA